MKNYIITTVIFLILVPVYSYSQNSKDHADDEKAIRQVVQNIGTAWAAGDGVKYADNFTDDIIYTVWNGYQINGRAENISGHQEIFDTIYKGTNVRFDVKKIRFLTNDVAAVNLQGEMFRGGKKVEDVPVVVPLMVFTKANGKWLVAAFQNTPTIHRGELVLGRKAVDQQKPD